MASDFATNPTTTSTYDDVSYASWITDEVLRALMAAVVSIGLLRQESLVGKASLAYKFPKADKFTAAAVSQGVETTNTALTTTSVTITAAEIGFQATVTDVLELSDIPAAHGARLEQIGRALADKMDVDIAALLNGFSNSVGSTGVDLSLDNILDAIYTLESLDAASLGSLVFLGHPRQTGDVRQALKSQQSVANVQHSIRFDASETGKLGKAVGPGYFGEWFGVDFYHTTNAPTLNLAADRSGAVFVRDYALGKVTKYDVRVEPMRWAPIRGWVLVGSADYGVGEIENNAGVAVVTDA
jgi:hypothetical protein